MHKSVTLSLAGATIAAACFAASPACAQQRAAQPVTGFYVGGAIGGSTTDVDAGSLAAVGFTTRSTDDSDFSWNLSAGYKFTQNWAVELGYVDLGTFGASGTFGGAPASVSADVTGWTVSAVGTLPLNDMFSLYGKLGFIRSKSKGSASVAGALGSATSNETDFTVGIGARYNFNRNVSLFVEANHYELGDNGDARNFLVGVRYDF
jgi:OmpA-OmpF porin, OOP family